MNLRMIGLGAAVAAVTLLPLVATAGPAGSPESPVPAAGSGPEPSAWASPAGGASAGDDSAPADGLPLLAESDSSSPPSTGPMSGRTARCGPALVSPSGIEAQTCVLTEGADIWARTYYRNTSGRELRAVLSLMGPAGRTVRTHCKVAGGDEPAACETPRERGKGTAEDYTAVAEFAADGDPESPLLLRSGSNAPQPSSR